MNEPVPGAASGGAPAGFGPAARALLRVSQGFALAGGLVFVALVAMSIVSIVGRKLAAAPVPGDVEVLQMCAAFACASFFAHCHLLGGDVRVDFFTARAPAGLVRVLDAVGSLLFAVVGAALAWRAGVGALDVREAGETSVILGWPIWVAQALMVPGFVLMTLAGLTMVGVHLRAPQADATDNNKKERAA